MSSLAATVGLLLSLNLSTTQDILYKGYSLETPCLPSLACTLAFISHNPMILRCPHTTLRDFLVWQYLDLAQTNKRPVTFLRSGSTFQPALSQANLRRLQLKSRFLSSNLYIPSPGTWDSGLYICRTGNTTLAYYQVDFQDAGSIHLSHASLGQTTLGNTTARLGKGAQAVLFTSWSSWQACDRCGNAGERKRIGFCYARVTPGKEPEMEELLPCGLAWRRHPTLPSRGPELRVEACQVPCNESFLLAKKEPTTMSPVNITYFQGTAYLRCPTSSIYGPVYWQEGNRTLTFLQILRQNSRAQSLDKATGGGILHISFQNYSQGIFYQCYVKGRLAGRFLIILPPAEGLFKIYSFVVGVVIGMGMVLAFLISLYAVESCRKKPKIMV